MEEIQKMFQQKLAVLDARKEALSRVSNLRAAEAEQEVYCEPLETNGDAHPVLNEIGVVYQNLLENGAKRINEMNRFLAYQERFELMNEYRSRILGHYLQLRDLVEQKENRITL